MTITFRDSPMAASQPQYARAATVCKHFCIANSTLWHWAKHSPGFPKPIKAGARVTLFDIEAIDRFIKTQGA